MGQSRTPPLFTSDLAPSLGPPCHEPFCRNQNERLLIRSEHKIQGNFAFYFNHYANMRPVYFRERPFVPLHAVTCGKDL